MIDINAAAPAPSSFTGITSEPLLFVLFILVILFSSNAAWGVIQKIVEKRKSKMDTTLDSKKLEFEIDKFSIETVQRAVITLNDDLKRLRSELGETKDELALVSSNYMMVSEKNAAMYRYIAKAVSRRRLEGATLVPVDEADVHIIPEVVNIIK